MSDLTNKLINVHDTISKKKKYPRAANAVPALVAATHEILIAARSGSNGEELLQHNYSVALTMAKRHLVRLL